MKSDYYLALAYLVFWLLVLLYIAYLRRQVQKLRTQCEQNLPNSAGRS